jgi:DNA-binding LacI/PurR family transcriptional regulator
MIRLKDIAARAGVSVMTVSKVLRDAPDIAAATKVRIRALSEEMGYVPDTRAQSLRNRTTQLFGLLIPSTTNPLFARIMMAVEEQAVAMNCDLLLAQTLNHAEREQAALRRMQARRVDGLLVVPVYRLESQAAVYDELRRRNTPSVVLGHRAPFCDGFVNVETDDLGGAAALTRHLIELGHRRIAFFAGSQAIPAAQERLEGHRRSLREAGIEFDDSLVFAAGSTIEEGSRAALQMLQEKTGATAVMAVNDLAALGAGTVLLQQGLRIPEDVSLTGFGNILLSEYFRVPLTTVSVPKHALGTAAMEMMRELLRGGRPANRRLATELVVRESTGTPPDKSSI